MKGLVLLTIFTAALLLAAAALLITGFPWASR